VKRARERKMKSLLCLLFFPFLFFCFFIFFVKTPLFSLFFDERENFCCKCVVLYYRNWLLSSLVGRFSSTKLLMMMIRMMMIQMIE
jgi:hypothetical protein